MNRMRRNSHLRGYSGSVSRVVQARNGDWKWVCGRARAREAPCHAATFPARGKLTSFQDTIRWSPTIMRGDRPDNFWSWLWRDCEACHSSAG